VRVISTRGGGGRFSVHRRIRQGFVGWEQETVPQVGVQALVRQKSQKIENDHNLLGQWVKAFTIFTRSSRSAETSIHEAVTDCHNRINWQ